MGYGVAPVAEFGGLDLRSAPDQSACVDGVDFDLDQRGAVRSRDGFAEFTEAIGSSTAGASAHIGAFYRYGSMQLLGGEGGATVVLDSSGAATGASESSCYGWNYTRFGSPTEDRLYFANAALGPTPILRWDGSSFTAPPDMPNGVYLAVQPGTNRLVIATGGLAVTNPNPYRIYLSKDKEPENFDTTDGAGNVDLTAGDGDPVTGLAAWRDFLFAFKRRRFYVFYGNSTDSEGDTEFRFREVDTGGIGHIADRSPLAVAPEGVYFLHSTGVYLTTGGPPQKVSGQLDPLFTGRGLSPFFSGASVSNPRYGALAYHDGRLYVSLPEGGTTNNVTYVYDGQGWVRWGFGFRPGQAISANLGWPNDGKATLLIVRDGKVVRWGDYADDYGTPIGSSYQTGFYDLGRPGEEKDIAATDLWGTGAVTVESFKDFGATQQPSSAEVTMGASPAIAVGRHDREQGGEVVSYRFSSDTRWSLQRYVHFMRGDRPPGSRSA